MLWLGTAETPWKNITELSTTFQSLMVEPFGRAVCLGARSQHSQPVTEQDSQGR